MATKKIHSQANWLTSYATVDTHHNVSYVWLHFIILICEFHLFVGTCFNGSMLIHMVIMMVEWE